MPKLLVAIVLIFSYPLGTLAGPPGNMIGNQSQNEGILVLPAPDNVTIDGDLNEWDLSGRIWVFADRSVRDRYSVKISAMWDPDNLYLAARWQDPTPMNSRVDPDFTPENGWRSDAWQMRFLTDHRSHLTSWYFTAKKTPVMHVSHHRKGVGGDVLQGKDGRTLGRGIEMAYAQTSDTSFAQEIKLPWKELYTVVPEVTPGLVFRLGNELLWGDVTGGKNRPEHRYADNMQAGVTSREFYWTKDMAWGNATLVAKGGVEKRRYFSEGAQPKGVIPVEVKVPASAKRFTVAINDAKGNRIRNLAADSDPTEFEVSAESGQRTLRILWDGLDDEGVLVPQGTYTITGLTHEGLDARYEMSYYNPGTPVWNTADGSGGWGGDHPDPIRVAMAGEMTILSWPYAEGGSGLIGLTPEGRKVWGERRGAKWLAADENYLYAVGKDHLKHLLTINRMRVKDGAYAPFILDGKARAFDLHLKDILGSEDEVADFAAIARYQNTLILAFADGTVAVLDAATAVPRKRLAVPGIIALAAKGDGLYGATETAVFAVDVKDGKTTPIPVSGVGKITDLAIDNSGNILVADMGPDKQVKAFTTAGKPVYTCGVKGGRPIRGTYNAQAMLRVSSIDVDHSGRVWAVERWANPRRVSVWSAKTGTLVKDYVGNTGYSARSTWMSDDPDFAYAGPVKMRLDRKAKTYSVTEILWVPDREKNEGFSLWSGMHWYACPKFFDITVQGQTKRLLYLNGVYGRYHAIYAKRNTCWQPVATITSVKQLKLEIPKLNLSEHADEDGVIWNDLNQDAAVSLDECTFVEGGLPAWGHWGTKPAEDGSLYLNSRRGESYRYRPVRFADDGAPIYGTEGLKKLAGKLQPDIVPLLGDKMVLNLGGHPKKGGWLQATSVDGSKTFWRYPNPYPGVHGSHNAPMPQPGTLIGPLNIIGTATVNETIGKVLMIRGNLGSDYLVTVKDGLLIGSLFGDLRLPMPVLPKTEAELYGKGVKQYTNGGEPFNGWFGSQKDGKIRMLNGMARQAAMIYEMEGLETIERLPATPLPVSAALLAKAELDNQARATKALKKASSHIHRVVSTPSFDGKLTAWKGIKHNKVVVKGNPSTGLARLAYSGAHLYAHFDIKDATPWLNRGKEWDKLFKTGDAVDIQLRTKASKSPKVVDGDLRIVVAPFQGKPVAVLMRPLDGAATANLKKAYNSPVTTKVFDRVEILKDAQIHVTTREDGYSVELGVPLAAIGLTLKPGDTLTGDLGFIVSDKTGTFNIARVYWSNKHTNLVNDLPHESWLAPSAWGMLEVK